MKKFKSTIIFILLSIFALSLISCSKKEEEKGSVKIGYLAITHALPLYIEKEVEKEDIELVKFGSWPELMEALNSGKIDGASVLVELAMKAKAQGVNIKAAALSHREGNAVVVNENIDSVKDLRGKTLARSPHALNNQRAVVTPLTRLTPTAPLREGSWPRSGLRGIRRHP